MAKKGIEMSENFLAMVRGIRELHMLLAAGKEDSPEAEAVREATDAPWASLSEVERVRIRNLSEDLYSLVEPPPVAQPMNPQAQAKLNEIIEARQQGEWDRALDLLRRWRAYLDPALVSCLRGSIWLDAGDPATAAVFFEHGTNLNPPPLRRDEGGVLRVGATRVSLDLVVEQYENGMAVEDIVRAYDSLALADVHAVVAYYLCHRAEITAYLKHRKDEAKVLRDYVAGNQPPVTREELRARVRAGEKANAPTCQ